MHKDVYNYVAFHAHNSGSLEEIRLDLRRTDELLRLLEVRVEELEKAGSRVSVSIKIKGERTDGA